jgi:hypothetical protein
MVVTVFHRCRECTQAWENVCVDNWMAKRRASREFVERTLGVKVRLDELDVSGRGVNQLRTEGCGNDSSEKITRSSPAEGRPPRLAHSLSLPSESSSLESVESAVFTIANGSPETATDTTSVEDSSLREECSTKTANR